MLGKPLNACSAVRACKAAPRHGRRSLLCIAKAQSYHIEVTSADGEDSEGVFKRFRNTCNLAGMVYEARRRQYFENPQDIKKRKQQEKGMRKMRDQREKFLNTYEEANTDVPPFTDLFQGEDDLYDVTGDMSIDEELDDIFDRPTFQQRRREMNQSDYSAPQAGYSRPGSSFPSRDFPLRGLPSENEPAPQATPSGSVRRSIPSLSPAAVTAEEEKNKPRAKPQVETARFRKAAKQQVANSPAGMAAARGRLPPTGSGVGMKPIRRKPAGNKPPASPTATE